MVERMDGPEPTDIITIDRPPLVRAEHGYTGFLYDMDALKTVPAGRKHLQPYVAGVIQHPQVIFNGLCRGRQDSVLCYCARPGIWLDTKGKPQSAKTNLVLIVFAELDDDLKKIVVFDWDSPFEDRVIEGYPVDWANRFGEPLWTKP